MIYYYYYNRGRQAPSADGPPPCALITVVLGVEQVLGGLQNRSTGRAQSQQTNLPGGWVSHFIYQLYESLLRQFSRDGRIFEEGCKNQSPGALRAPPTIATPLTHTG